jgi:hypothetical protein
VTENNTLADALHRLTDEFIGKRAHGLVTAVAIGAPPEPAPQTDMTVFIDPAAADCEERTILAEAHGLVKPFTVTGLRCGPFEGLAALGGSIGPLDAYQYNIPNASAGTYGLTVAANGRWYLLSSNHVLANNGQAPVDTPAGAANGTKIFNPGPLDAIGGGVKIATLTNFVPLVPGLNQGDCAWAELAAPPSPIPGPANVVTPMAASVTTVSKTGRTSGGTTSTIQFPQMSAVIDFGFGTYRFTNQAGTWDAAGADPPFAEPGDSGALVTVAGSSTQGIGLVCARGYAYDKGEFLAYVILICPLSAVVSGMESNGLTAPVIYAV